MTVLFTEWEKEFRVSRKGKLALKELETLKRFKPEFAIQLGKRQSLPAAAPPLFEPLRPDASHDPSVEPVKEQSDVGSLVVVPPEEELYFLERRVLNSCYRAKCFKDNGDRLTKLRRQDKNVIARIPQQLRAVKAIRQFIGEFPVEASWAYALGVPFGPKEPGYFRVEFLDEVNPYDKEKRNIAQALDAVLAKYESGLSKPIVGVKYGRFLHRYQYGCLLYQAPIDDGKHRPDPLTLLLYELSLYL